MNFPLLNDEQFEELVTSFHNIAKNLEKGTAGRQEVSLIKHNVRLLEMHNMAQKDMIAIMDKIGGVTHG